MILICEYFNMPKTYYCNFSYMTPCYACHRHSVFTLALGIYTGTWHAILDI